MSRIYVSRSNPVPFVWENRTKAGAYNDFNYDDLYDYETLKAWEEPVVYEQKWQNSDAIRPQFIADFSGITLRLINEETGQEYSTLMDQKQQYANNPGFYLYEADISLTSIPPGNYIMRGQLGLAPDSDTIRSRCSLCIKQRHDGTGYIEFFNSKQKAGAVFEKGYRPSIRVELDFDKMEVGSKDSMFEDQPLNMTMIDSKQYRIFPVVFGGTYGIPDWMLEKLNIIFGMDNVRINGKQFCKAEAGQEFEGTAIEGYPLRGFRYKLRESLNRSSMIIDPTVNTERKVIIMTTAQTDMFGDIENLGSNQILIKSYD